MSGLKGLAEKIETGTYFHQDNNEYENKLVDDIDKAIAYVSNLVKESHRIILELTASIQNKAEKHEKVKHDLLPRRQAVFRVMKSDTPYLFEYTVGNDQGQNQKHFFTLTLNNTKLCMVLLKDGGLLITVVEHFDPYEDEDLPFPS